METQFRLVQAACPRGAGRDEGPAFLPVLITKRQGARRQINGKGLGTNAGHVWWWDLALRVCIYLFFVLCVPECFLCVRFPRFVCM